MPSASPARRMKLGILANEFFDPALGAMGGFGWAASRVARLFAEAPEIGIDPVLLRADVRDASTPVTTGYGVRALAGTPHVFDYWRTLRREAIDLLLCIDYRPAYRRTLLALPRTPAIVWARDPRDHADWRTLASLRVPGSDAAPRGVDRIDCSSLGDVLRWSRRVRRDVLFATPSPPLGGKVAEAYAIEQPPVEFLPNPLELATGTLVKSEAPVVLFLGRLDPYKRPWIAIELARRFPHVEFMLLGQSHFSGEGGWELPADLPTNVHALGHHDGEEKRRQLERSWILLNTSIHEGLPVSFQEALAYELPIVSGRNPEQVTERFGIWVGQTDGAGLDAIDRYENALRRLLEDHEVRRRLGREGRAWVEQTHGPARFLDAFMRLVERLLPRSRRKGTGT